MARKKQSIAYISHIIVDSSNELDQIPELLKEYEPNLCVSDEVDYISIVIWGLTKRTLNKARKNIELLSFPILYELAIQGEENTICLERSN